MRWAQALTLGHVLDVGRVLQDLGEALQQHGRLVVPVGDVLRQLEHLVQRRRLHLPPRTAPRVLACTALPHKGLSS